MATNGFAFTRRAGRRMVLFAVAALGILPPAAARLVAVEPPPEDAESRYYRGLRERRLYRLAEGHLLDRLARPDLPPAQRVALTLELARTLTEHADYAADADRLALWNQAGQVLELAVEAERDNPRRVLLQAQQALLDLAIGQWHLWQRAIVPEDSLAGGQAAAALSQALERLSGIEIPAGETRVTGGKARERPPGLTPHEARQLEQQLRLRRAQAGLDLASLQPPSDAQRASLIIDAQRALKPMAEARSDDEFTWQCRVAYVRATRLQQDYEGVFRQVELLDKRQPPAEIALALATERARALVALGRYDEAVNLVDQVQAARGPWGEAAVVGVQALAEQFRLAASAGNAARASEVSQVLEDRVAAATRSLGGFWAARCAALHDGVREAAALGPDLAALVRRGRAEYARGDKHAAARLFGQAASAAHASGAADQAFQFGYTRASIEVELQQWENAAADLELLIESFPSQTRTPEARLLLAFALGKLHDAEPSPRRREQYAAALQAHRRAHPAHPTAVEATWMLARLHERGAQWSQALELYRQVPDGHARTPGARVAVARCHEQIVERLRQMKQNSSGPRREALAELLPWCRFDGPPDEPAAEVALRAARLLLGQQRPDYAAADQLLERVLQVTPRAEPPGAPEAPAAGGGEHLSAAEIGTQAMQLRIVSLAGQGSVDQAAAILDRLSSVDPRELLRILHGLAPMAEQVGDPFHKLAQLRLDAALLLERHRDKLGERDAATLDLCLARGYVDADQARRSLPYYARLVEVAQPDKRLLEEQAGVLVRLGDRTSLQHALRAWRRLGSLCDAGSQEWLAARYEECRCLVLLGECAQASKLLRKTRLLYPKLGNQELAAGFSSLEAQCAPQAATR